MENQEKIDYQKSREIMQDNLIKLGLKVDKNNFRWFYCRDTIIDYKSYFYIYPHDYLKVNITIKARHSDLKRFLRNFDVVNGDYKKFASRIKEVSQKSLEHKKYREDTEKEEEENRERLSKELSDFDVKKLGYKNAVEFTIDSIYIQVKGHKPDEYDIEFSVPTMRIFGINRNQLIEFTKKLKELLGYIKAMKK